MVKLDSKNRYLYFGIKTEASETLNFNIRVSDVERYNVQHSVQIQFEANFRF